MDQSPAGRLGRPEPEHEVAAEADTNTEPEHEVAEEADTNTEPEHEVAAEAGVVLAPVMTAVSVILPC